MPLSKSRMRERKKVDRAVKPKSNLIANEIVKPDRGERQTKLEKVGLAVGSDGTLDLTRSSPLKHESNTRLPLYDWQAPQVGQKVILNGQVVTVPEMDADGVPIEAGSTGRLVSENLFEPPFNPDPKPEKKKRRG